MGSPILEVATHDQGVQLHESSWPLFVLFFISGIPALLYQVVWQRALFTIYGVNIESVTIIVTVFMLGLGLGSLAGGRLSGVPGIRSLLTFGLIELSIALVGSGSLRVFHAAAQLTSGRSASVTAAVTFGLLLIPTLLMGSTLPLLVDYLVSFNGNVGKSVGALYAVNTLGSGVACLLAAFFLMRALGESGVINLAASINLLVGSTAVIWSFRRSQTAASQLDEASVERIRLEHRTIPLGAGMCMAAVAGFVALGYEILWYRMYSFASAGTAPSFAKLLGFYLIGIAYGSFRVHKTCNKKLKSNLGRTLRTASIVLTVGAIASFLVEPAVASMVSSRVPLDITYPLVSIAAALLGAVFPLVAHAAIDPGDETGRRVSYLYLSNIIGSTLGSFLIGFEVLNYVSIETATLLLLASGIVLSIVLALMVRPIQRSLLIMPFAACLLLTAFSNPLFHLFYERLQYRDGYASSSAFKEIVENRSGIITVDTDERVWGGGAYDGQFSIDPVNGRNGIFRAFVIPAIHPHPRRVLVIGLASGSWAQVLANYPEVEEMTIVEINPGYLQLIRQRPVVASLLQNPKVHIVIDDGRRWLVAHPDRKFDFVLMNTTHHWRANVTNLLSVEFLELLRTHLNSGGVAYYNTTSSGEVQLTGATVFRGALRIANFLAVSDSPISFDRERCRRALISYTVDGHPIFDLSRQADRDALDRIVMLPYRDTEKGGQFIDMSIEDRASLLARLRGNRIITDDNMGAEWP